MIHGPNNVGKSNVLQAMDLYFRAEAFLSENAPAGEHIFSADDFAEKWGYSVAEIFDFLNPMPIDIRCICNSADQSDPQSRLAISVRPTRGGEQQIAVEMTHDGKFCLDNRFALIGTNRRLMLEDRTPPGLHIVPQQLRDALFDAKESRDARMVRRWELFVEAMRQFEDILGQGVFHTAFDRPNNKADLVFDRGNVREPLDLLGSGVQQIVALLGQLILSPTRFHR